MRVSTLAIALLATASSALAVFHGVPRDTDEFRKKHVYITPPCEEDRWFVQIPPSKNDTDDVSDFFEQGLRIANNGGTLWLLEGQTYIIGKPLNLTFLNDVHVRLEGTIKFTDDTKYWQANAFYHPFQKSLMFWKWGGKDIKIYGSGTIDGNGQRWYNEFAGLEILSTGNTYLRPILFYVENATNIAIEGINYKNSPVWNNFIVTSKNIYMHDLTIVAKSNNLSALPKNTDFFDSLNIYNLTVERVWVNIGDDCFSPKSNASLVHVNTMYCNGSHGQSMGSIGQYAGEKSIIEDVVIENVWLLNGDNGARIKSWAGPNVGYGYVNNVTFRNFWLGHVDYSVQIDSCYFNINSSTCAKYPSQVNVTNVKFENFYGTTSGKNGRVVGKLSCSSSESAVCNNITFVNYNVTSPCGGPPVVACDGVKGDTGLKCVSVTSDEYKAALKANCTSPQVTLDKRPW
ncbi:glycoside hydrolase family 28 protein [Gonapodya prolifera JEL478]|uniref:galacturonan 1,4-alpha-galacturonidase n=1 Tax=Gonapodya prolifera (strain JEL478) TaxID=1344416 RepID=A0A139AV55_GONPJ|nr:glycoside hydrolase family 28 protein [Gonapodya prolifera JEL478]|eukprot:KXS20620.1 glycoside hydrolase family 28 protein [Gonapodya prolifera JEL478]